MFIHTTLIIKSNRTLLKKRIIRTHITRVYTRLRVRINSKKKNEMFKKLTARTFNSYHSKRVFSFLELVVLAFKIEQDAHQQFLLCI